MPGSELDDLEAPDNGDPLATHGTQPIDWSRRKRQVYLDGEAIGSADGYAALFDLLRRHHVDPIKALLTGRIVRAGDYRVTSENRHATPAHLSPR